MQVIGYHTTVKQLKRDIAMETAGIGEFTGTSGTGSSQTVSNGGTGVDHLNATPAKTALQLFEGIDESTELRPGAWFIAELDLGKVSQQEKKTMNQVIALDAAPDAENRIERSTVRLYARVIKQKKKEDEKPQKPDNELEQKEQQNGTKTVPNDKDEQTEYRIDIRNLRIFDGVVTLNGSGRYLLVPKELSVDAKLGLRISDSPGAEELNFEVNLTMSKNTTSFDVSIKTTPDYKPPSLTNPFDGKMFNVRLEGLRVKGSSTRKAGAPGGVERECTIYGSAVLGGGSDASKKKSKLLALVHFEGGKPVVGVVEFTRKVTDDPSPDSTSKAEQPKVDEESKAMVPWEQQDTPVKMSEIYSDILIPNAKAEEGDSVQPYPEDCDDFELREAYMSYNRTSNKVVILSRAYEPGFIISGSFLLFQKPISVRLHIKDKREGFKVQGTYEETVNLSIIQFTAFNNTSLKREGKGLTIALETARGVSLITNAESSST